MSQITARHPENSGNTQSGSFLLVAVCLTGSRGPLCRPASRGRRAPRCEPRKRANSKFTVWYLLNALSLLHHPKVKRLSSSHQNAGTICTVSWARKQTSPRGLGCPWPSESLWAFHFCDAGIWWLQMKLSTFWYQGQELSSLLVFLLFNFLSAGLLIVKETIKPEKWRSALLCYDRIVYFLLLPKVHNFSLYPKILSQWNLHI